VRLCFRAEFFNIFNHANYYHRVYTRNGSVIGVLTLTTMEKDLSFIRPVYDSVLTSISVSSKD